MSRTAVYTGLVLRSRSSGEANNEVFLLTAEEGIIRATVFGGPKSKLRAFASPYNSGQVWVYRDKTKDYAKLNDFDVRSWRPGLRELYDRTMAAAAVAETILTSHGGGGDWGTALKLAAETLDTLETANEELSSRLLVHFLWRWCAFLGIQPHVENCARCFSSGSCAGNFAAGSGQGGDAPLWFDVREGAAHCVECNKLEPSVQRTINSEQKNSCIKLNLGCRKWLSVTGELEPSLLHRYSMDHKSFGEAKALVCAVLAEALGKRLASWDW